MIKRLFEYGNYHTLPPDLHLPGFKAFLKEVWKNRHWLYETGEKDHTLTEEQDAVLRRQGQSLLNFDGPEVQARNYAGFIQYHTLHLQLLPKIFKDTSLSTPVIFEHLLYYLSYGKSCRFPFTWQGLSTGSQDNLLQVLIHWFAAYSEKTLTDKPYQAYHEKQGPTGFMQGKLDVPAYVRHTLGSGQWQELYTRHAPFVYDNDFNRLVKYTSTRLLPLASEQTGFLLNSVLHLLQEVSEKAFSYADCESVQVHRLQEDQLNILQMCRFFMSGEKMKVPEEKGNFFSFIVPMERVFEEFVAGFVEKHFPELGAEVQSSQDLAFSAGKKIFRIKNDIWLPGTSVIIDTKYKCIDSQPQNVISQIEHSDLYQMVAYAVSRKCTEIHLLYPQTKASDDIEFDVRDALADKNIRIHVHLIPVKVAGEQELMGKSVADILTPILLEKFAAIFSIRG
jgi:5-methylcytosine-specific restriction enzyme subunit McrC